MYTQYEYCTEYIYVYIIHLHINSQFSFAIAFLPSHPRTLIVSWAFARASARETIVDDVGARGDDEFSFGDDVRFSISTLCYQ